MKTFRKFLDEMDKSKVDARTKEGLPYKWAEPKRRRDDLNISVANARRHSERKRAIPYGGRETFRALKLKSESHEDAGESGGSPPAGYVQPVMSYRDMSYRVNGKRRTARGMNLQLKWLKNRIKGKG